MSVPGTPEAIRKTILVRCDLESAFRTWTERIDVWWPKGHSRSGDPATAVFLERHVGGRLYERTPDGVEHAWGSVVVWNPPRRLSYHWYLGSSAERPTLVDVRFSEEGGGYTRVEVTHGGPDLVGAPWARTSHRFDAAWERVLPAFAAACPPAAEQR